MFPRRALPGLAGLPLALGSRRAGAQGTARPVQFWVANAPGGSVDLLARAIARHMERTGGAAIVSNRAGGAGVVMLNALRAAPPDGLTFGMGVNASMTFVPLTITPPPFGVTDFAHVARLVRAELAVCATAERGPADAAGLAAWVRARPGGQASVAVQDPQLGATMRALGRHLGVTLEPVTVRGGAEGLTQLLGGHVDFATLAGIQAPLVREGRLRELVALGSAPLRATPAAPTLGQLGLELAIDTVFQVMAPRGTPEPAIAAMAEQIRMALEDAEIRALIDERLGLVPSFAGPAETTAAMGREALAQRALFEAFGR